MIGRGIIAGAVTLAVLLSAAQAQAATDRVDYRADAGSPPKTFYKTPSAFKLQGECTAAGRLKVTLIGLDDHAIVHAVSDLNGASYLGDDDLTEGEELSLGPLDLDKRAGILTGVAISGEVQTVTWLAEDTRGADPYGGRSDCVFVGTTDSSPAYFGGTAGVTSEAVRLQRRLPAGGRQLRLQRRWGRRHLGRCAHALSRSAGPDQNHGRALQRLRQLAKPGSSTSTTASSLISGAEDSSIGWGVLTESNDVSTLTSYTAMGEDNTGANDPFGGASADDDCVMGTDVD